MRKQRFFCLTFLVIILSVLSGCDGGEQSSPESVARAYIKAMAAEDYEKLRSLRIPEAKDTRSERSCEGHVGAPCKSVFDPRIDGASTEDNTVRLAGRFYGLVTVYNSQVDASSEDFVNIWINTTWMDVYTRKYDDKYYVIRLNWGVMQYEVIP